MKLCWVKVFIICILLALLLCYLITSVGMLFIMIPTALFELIGFSLYLNELDESGAKLTFSEESYFVIVLFWIVVIGFISWLLCKMKSFSKGNQNE